MGKTGVDLSLTRIFRMQKYDISTGLIVIGHLVSTSRVAGYTHPSPLWQDTGKFFGSAKIHVRTRPSLMQVLEILDAKDKINIMRVSFWNGITSALKGQPLDITMARRRTSDHDAETCCYLDL